MKELIHRIQSKKACIGVIGIGYVGLPLVIRFCEKGFTVTGVDIDPAKVASINAGSKR
jgi:UDP-N-acetyl-D-glucosamine dehydrogenase